MCVPLYLYDCARLFTRVRELCGAARDDVVIADEPGFELQLNGRAINEPFQMTHLVRRGAYPAALWIADVMRPEVTCAVVSSDLLERSLSAEDERNDRFPVEVRRALQSKFVLVTSTSFFWVYRVRSRPIHDGAEWR